MGKNLIKVCLGIVVFLIIFSVFKTSFGSNDSGEPLARINVSPDDDPYLGPKNAPILMIEFSDYKCPDCKNFYDQNLNRIKSNYIDKGKLRFVYRDMVMLSPLSQKAAEASECAHDQKKFWEYLDKLFKNQQFISEANLKKWASDLGLNTSKFNKCLDMGSKSSEVNKDKQDGSSYGVSAVPTFFIGNSNRKYLKITDNQPYNLFKNYLDNELNECDKDSDGFYDPLCNGKDCNDSNSNINPNASEICDDGIDNDCDGRCDYNFSSCTDGSDPGDSNCTDNCGDGSCELPENSENCPEDCGGGGSCTLGESRGCFAPDDCPGTQYCNGTWSPCIKDDVECGLCSGSISCYFLEKDETCFYEGELQCHCNGNCVLACLYKNNDTNKGCKISECTETGWNNSRCGEEKMCCYANGTVCPSCDVTGCEENSCGSSTPYNLTFESGWNSIYISSSKNIPISALSDCGNVLAIGLNEDQLLYKEKNILRGGSSYLIRTSKSCSYSLKTPRINKTALTLKKGWNFEGSDFKINITLLKSKCGSSTLVIGLNENQKLYKENSVMKPGEGYLIRVKDNCKFPLA